MRARSFVNTFASLVAAAIAVGCIVSTYEKVDDRGGGNTGDCVDTCVSGPKGETPCCFDYPSEGPDANDKCGYQVPAYQNVCLPLDAPGEEDDGCPDHQTIDSLDGCCMPNGLCGYEDENHGLGCMVAEAFGSGPGLTSCGTNPCGEYCDIADALGCSLVEADNSLRVWECAEECLGDSDCQAELKKVVDSCSAGEPGDCQSLGDPVFRTRTTDVDACLLGINQLAKCLETELEQPPDCAQYCRLITDQCDEADSQYTDYDDCMDSCGELAPGSFSDLSGNTLACRFEVLKEPASSEECKKAGRSGQSTTAGSCG